MVKNENERCWFEKFQTRCRSTGGFKYPLAINSDTSEARTGGKFARISRDPRPVSRISLYLLRSGQAVQVQPAGPASESGFYFGLTAFLFTPFFLTVFGTSFNGSSSPSTGGFPLPTRARIRLTRAGSARRARSSKYSCVRIAETFSASASVMSWLRATPSDSAALRASANRVGGTRKAKLLRLIDSLLRFSSLGFLC